MRVIAIDYGLRRIGIAQSDMSKIIAYPLKTIFTDKTMQKTVDNLLLDIKDTLKETEIILVGLPLHLDGNESEMSLEVKKFVEILKSKTTIPIKLVDERLSSAQVEKDLKNTCYLNSKKRAKMVDPLAATLLVEDYLRSSF